MKIRLFVIRCCVGWCFLAKLFVNRFPSLYIYVFLGSPFCKPSFRVVYGDHVRS